MTLVCEQTEKLKRLTGFDSAGEAFEYGGKIYSRKFPAEGEDRTNEMQLALLGQFRRTFG
jgi:hypothetical protein